MGRPRVNVFLMPGARVLIRPARPQWLRWGRMNDLTFIALSTAFFAVSAGYAWLCGKLR